MNPPRRGSRHHAARWVTTSLQSEKPVSPPTKRPCIAYSLPGVRSSTGMFTELVWMIGGRNGPGAPVSSISATMSWAQRAFRSGEIVAS